MKMNLKQAKELYIRAKDAYYNSGHPIITDAQFDKLEDWIAKKDPAWSELKKTGILTGKKQEVKLPFYMPSLNKYYPEEVDKLWRRLPKEDAYIYMAKLDGCSVLLEYEDGKPIALTTRGNGEFGKDITFLIPYLNIKQIDDKDYHAFRCEAILAKHLFVKWNKEFDNARNMVSGLLNRRQPHPAFKDISFVVLGEYGKSLEQGLITAAKLGLDVVYYKKAFAHKEADMFAAFKHTMFDTDGVVISTPDFMYQYESAEKPKRGIIAYKINPETDSAVQAVVDSIVWQTSAFGRLIPKIKIQSVMVQGAKITYVTCHNAQWMEDHKIGPGAVVSIIRSGEVIPKIIGVVKPAEKLQLPEVSFYKKGVHFYQTDNSEDSYINSIVRCLNNLHIDFVKDKTIERIYSIYKHSNFFNNQPIDALISILKEGNSLKARFKLEFGNKNGVIIYENLNKIVKEQHTIIDWLMATMAFDAGIGRKRLKAVNDAQSLESMCSWTKEAIVNKLSSIKSIGSILAEQIAEGLVKFYQWSARYPWLKFKPIDAEANIIGPMSGVNITFTGYRDSAQEKAILSLGGNIVNFGAKTTWLLYKSDGKRSSKIAKAGDKAITWDILTDKYPDLLNHYFE